MKRILKILFFAFLIICVFAQYKIFDQKNLTPANNQQALIAKEHDIEVKIKDVVKKDNYFISDTIYRWDDQEFGWIKTDESQEVNSQEVFYELNLVPSESPVELDWQVLMDIQYKLRYFKELDMEVYAPVFSKAAEALHGKEVIIEGFVIPYDESGEVLSLSYNPFASCFFCGKASPASIISMYLSDKKKRYKLDDFKKFRGTLFLNLDDPNEFYYILKNAKED